MSTAKRAILVLGMHRSGTSAVAGLLIRCGLQPPKTLMPSNEQNAEGYWESSVFHEFHERFLNAAGTRWDAYTGIDADWLESNAADGWREECRALLRREFSAATPFVLKDPRICRFLPFWLRVLEAEGVEASAVLVLRHPFEVAASLAARNQLTRSVSLLIWLRHLLDAEMASRSIRRCVIGYEDILTDWRGSMERLAATFGESWSGSWGVAAAGTDQFVRQSLQHHRVDENAAQVPPLLADWVARAWTAMSALVDGDPHRISVAQGALDDVRLEFEGAVAVFGVDAEERLQQASDRISSLEQTLVTERADVRKQIADMDAANHLLAGQVDRLQHERADLEVRVGGLMADVAAHQAHVGGLLAEVAAHRAHVNDLTAHVAALQAHVKAVDAERAALRSSMSWRVTAPLRAISRVLR